MLNEKQVPKAFWLEAVRWCVHIHNRCPTVVVENKTPEEAWSGEKPMVEYFQIFGCVAHVHVPDQRRSRLDDKSKKCVFLGVNDESKAWRLYDPVSKKIIISKDVVFEEEESWECSGTEEEIKRDIFEWEDEEDDHNEKENDGTSSNNLSCSSSSSSSSPTESPPNETNSNTHGELAEGRGVRERRAPGWMADYETWEGLFAEENLNAMMMVIDMASHIRPHRVPSKYSPDKCCCRRIPLRVNAPPSYP